MQESFAFVSAPSASAQVKPPFDPIHLATLAAKGVYLGTSSWKYRGWEGLVYRGGYESEAYFQRHSLREYSTFFSTVGVDFTYYAWPQIDMLGFLAECTPENFRLCLKATKRATVGVFPDLPAYGKWAGRPNPEYLDSDRFEKLFLEPLKVLHGRLGPVILEFSGPEEQDLDRLKAFLKKLPKSLEFALEFRKPELVKADFYRWLLDLGVAPVFTSWTKMPELHVQWQAYQQAGGGSSTLPLLVLGHLQSGTAYDDAVRRFQPYNQILEPSESVRLTSAEVAQFAMHSSRKAFILLSNRLEGSAPLSVGAVASRLS